MCTRPVLDDPERKLPDTPRTLNTFRFLAGLKRPPPYRVAMSPFGQTLGSEAELRTIFRPPGRARWPS